MKKKRFEVVKLLDTWSMHNGWCVDDVIRNTTKAIFYDEAAEEMARDFCRQMNRCAKEAKR